MKHGIAILAALFGGSLVACGGGGSGSDGYSAPVVLPQVTPAAQSYTLGLKIIGGANPTTQSVASLSSTIQAASTANIIPNILLVSPDSSSPQAQFTGYDDSQSLAQVTVSPQPSASPSASWVGGDSDVSLVVQNPSISSAIYATQVNTTDATALAISVSVGSTAIGTITPKVYVYPRLTVACPTTDQSKTAAPQEWYQGVTFDSNGNPVQASSPGASDLYADGPQCYGSFVNSTETGTTIHFPYGGHVYTNTYKPFDSMNAGDFVGDQTSATISSISSAALANQPIPDIIVFKDRAGAIHLWAITISSQIGSETGAHKECGHAVDLSC